MGSRYSSPATAISIALILVAVPAGAQTLREPSMPLGPLAAQARAEVDARPPANSLGALSSRVRPGDTVSVLVANGEDILGMFSHASDASLTLEVDGRTREIPVNTVRQVVRRRGANRLRRGLWIGAPAGAFLGSSFCYRVESPQSGTGPSCGASVLGGAALGVAVGALIGSRIWRPAVVYSTRPVPPPPQAIAAVDAPTPVAARTPIPARDPVASLGALPSRVLPFEKIYVRKGNGEEIVGSFSRASDTSLTLEVDGQAREIPAGDVRDVRRGGANRVHQGMLFGFLAGATVADLAVTSSGSQSEWSLGEELLAGTLGGGAVGVVWGAIIGAFVHQRPVVYRAPAPTVQVMPMIAPGGAGVMMSVRF